MMGKKKNIRLRTGVLFSMMAVLLSLSACHGSKEGNSFEVPDSFDESRNYEITFWAKNDTNKNQTNIYEKSIENFEELYPNIDVNIRLYTDYGKIYNDVITNISTDTTPNVCITYPDHVATYLMGEDTVVPLDDLFDDEKYGLSGSEIRYDAPSKEEIIPEFLSECKLGNNYYAIPYMRSTEVCYVNKTYVEQLGFEMPEVLSWDFVWEVSEAATEKNDDGTYKINGQKVMVPFIYKSTDNMMIQMLKQEGQPYSDTQGNIGLFGDATKNNLMTIASHTKTGAFSTFKISGYPANFLNAGQCIFAVDSSAGSTWMGTDAPLSDIAEDSIVHFETAVYPVPQFMDSEGNVLVDDTEGVLTDDARYTMISQGPSICVFNKKDPQEVLAAWLFAQYMLTNDVQIAYSETEGYVPVTSKAQESSDYQDYLSRQGEDNNTYYDVKIEATKLLLDNQKYTFVTSVFNGSTSLRDAAGQLVESVTKSVRRKTEIDDAYLDQLYEDTISLYRLDQTSASGSGKAEFGEMPAESLWLIRILIIAWILIAAYFIHGYVKKKGIKL